MTMTLESSVVYSSQNTGPYLTSPHTTIMSTKTQQSNGTNHCSFLPYHTRFSPQPQPLPQLTESQESSEEETGGETGEGEGEGETSETSESKYSSDEEDVEEEISPPEDFVALVEGYEMVSYETVVVPPPPPTEKEREDKQTEAESVPCYTESQVVVKITEDEARSFLLAHVASHLCYGREAAKQMVITGMEYVPALHYELQTFTERRETCWSYAPHRPDTKVDPDSPEGISEGPGPLTAPLPWQIEERPGRMFRDEVRLVTAPHTGVIKPCHKCRGTGGVTCGECGGRGWVRCLHCHGDVHLPEGGGGSLDRDRCYYCQHSKHGHGHLECSKCKVS